MINDKLLESTMQEYKDFVDVLSKFPVECDRELMMALNKQLSDITTEHSKIDPEKEFKTSEMKFDKESKLKKVSDSVKKQRVRTYWYFNRFFVKIFPYLVSNPAKPFKGQLVKNTSAAQLFNEVKHLVLTGVKMKFVDSAIEKLPGRRNGKENVNIKRHLAYEFADQGKLDHTAEFTIFGQVFK